VAIAENIFKVTGQRSRSRPDQMHFCDGGWQIQVSCGWLGARA